jgi:group I intron endonuclease
MAETLEEKDILNNNCGVYLIVSPTNGRYVGSSKNLKKRFNRYKNYSCSRQSAILASLNKYGFEKHSFKVLYNCDESELLFWERVFGDIYLASANFPNGLNIALPGYNDVPAMRTQEWKDRISISQKERFKDPIQRQKTSIATKAGFTQEVKDKMSYEWKVRSNTDVFRKARSVSQKQYFSSPEARYKARQKTIAFFLNNPEAFKVQQSGIKKYYQDNPTARKDRMIQRFKDNPELAKQHSGKMKDFYNNNPEARKAASEKTKEQMENNHPRAKKIIDTETGEIFKSITQVSIRIGKPKQTIRNWVNNISVNTTSYKYL